MNGIKSEIEKLTQEVIQILIKPKQPSTQHLFDINYYSFSHQALHAAQMLLECLQIDVLVKNQYKKLVSKMKEAAKCRPEEQSEEEQQLAGKDEISIFLNTRKPIVENKERGQLYKFLTIRQQTQKDNQNFLHHMNKVKAMTLIKQKSHKTQTKEQEIQTEIAWISQLQYRSKQQANYYQNYLRSYIQKFISRTNNNLSNDERNFQDTEQNTVEKKDKFKKTAQRLNENKKLGKNTIQKNSKKQLTEEFPIIEQIKKSNQSSKNSIGSLVSNNKPKNLEKHKIKKTNSKALFSQQPPLVQSSKTKHSIAGQIDFNTKISEENIEIDVEEYDDQSKGEEKQERKLTIYKEKAEKGNKKDPNLEDKVRLNPNNQKTSENSVEAQKSRSQICKIENEGNFNEKSSKPAPTSSDQQQQKRVSALIMSQKQRKQLKYLKENRKNNKGPLPCIVDQDRQDIKLKKQDIESGNGLLKNTNSNFHSQSKKKTEADEINRNELKIQKNKQNLPTIGPIRTKQKTYIIQRGSSNNHKFNSSYYGSSRIYEKKTQINFSCHEPKKCDQMDSLKQKISTFLNKPDIEINQLRQNQKQIMEHLQGVRRECVDSNKGILMLNKRQENQIKQCIRMMEAIHGKVCGKTCKHLDRFYSIMSLFKVSGKKQLKLSKFIIDSNNVM